MSFSSNPPIWQELDRKCLTMGFYKIQYSNECFYIRMDLRKFSFFSLPLTGWTLRVKVSMDLGAFAYFIKLCVIFFHFIMSMKRKGKKAAVVSILISNSLLKES